VGPYDRGGAALGDVWAARLILHGCIGFEQWEVVEILGASMGEIPHMAFFLLGVCCFLFSAYGLCFALLDFSRLFCTFFLLNIVTGSTHVGVTKKRNLRACWMRGFCT